MGIGKGTMADLGFWADRRVLITGHTGFKGSWLALWLSRLGAAVSGIALDPPTRPSLFELARVHEALESDFRVDIREAGVLRSALETAAPEVIFHLAAQPLVREGYDRPADTFATNVMGTVHLLDAATEIACVRAILVVTTDKVYENREWPHPYREPDQLGGEDPYAASKACAELVAGSMRACRPGSARIATARAGNVVGGGDFARDRLVPDCIRAFAAGAPVTLRYPDAIRPFQHVLDPLAGYLALAERLHAGEEEAGAAWNFGPEPGGEAPVAAVAHRLAAIWGEGAAVNVAETPGPHEAGILRLDSTKARSLLGWRPVWGLEETLNQTAQWYRDWHLGADMTARTCDEIARFEADHATLYDRAY